MENKAKHQFCPCEEFAHKKGEIVLQEESGISFACGGRYHKGVVAISLKANTPAVIQLEERMACRNIAYTRNNGILLLTGGVYEINFMLSSASAEAGIFTLIVRQNAEGIAGACISRAMHLGMDAQLAGSILLPLVEGDKLDLVLISSVDNHALICCGTSAYLTVKKIG